MLPTSTSHTQTPNTQIQSCNQINRHQRLHAPLPYPPPGGWRGWREDESLTGKKAELKDRVAQLKTRLKLRSSLSQKDLHLLRKASGFKPTVASLRQFVERAQELLPDARISGQVRFVKSHSNWAHHSESDRNGTEATRYTISFRSQTAMLLALERITEELIRRFPARSKAAVVHPHESKARDKENQQQKNGPQGVPATQSRVFDLTALEKALPSTQDLKNERMQKKEKIPCACGRAGKWVNKACGKDPACCSQCCHESGSPCRIHQRQANRKKKKLDVEQEPTVLLAR